MDDRGIQLHLLTEQEEAQRPSSPPAADFANIATPPPTRLTTWMWEIGGIVLSAALMVALSVVLRCYEGQRQPTWNHMSLNTLIAWMSMVSRALILYSASQGLGQLKWAWFATERRPMEDLANFDSASRGVLGSRALIYRVRARHFAVVGSLAIVLAVGFDPFLQNLVHYVSRDVVDASQPCLLGNVSMYNTVGPLTGGDWYYVDPVLKANVYRALFDQSSVQSWATPQYTCATGNCIWDPTANLAMRALCSNVTSYLTRNCSYNSYFNTSAPFDLCNVTLGDTLSTYYAPGGGLARPMGITTVDAGAALGNPEPLQSEIIGIEIVLSPQWKNGSGLGLTSPGELFALGFESWNSITNFFENLFTGYVDASSDVFEIQGTGTGTYATTDTLEALFYGNFSSSCDVDDQLTCAMDNVAAAISKTIRDSAFTSGVQYLLNNTVNTNITTGHTITSASFVVVRWEWLVFPLLVWLLATVSWIGTLLRSGRNLPVWKNDVLPLLFLYHPPQTDQTAGKDATVIHQQQIHVKLDEGQLVDA